LLAALVGNIGFSFPPATQITGAIMTMAVTMVLLVVLMISLGRYLPSSGLFSRLVLAPELSSGVGYTSSDSPDWLVGKVGQALTALRPAGTAVFDDKRYDVVSEGDFIDAGTTVQVMRVAGNKIEVRTLKQLEQA
jgi:membrane-bound serine protease (ClpP class)